MLTEKKRKYHKIKYKKRQEKKRKQPSHAELPPLAMHALHGTPLSVD